MTEGTGARSRRARAVTGLTAIVVLGLAVVGALAALLVAHHSTTPPPADIVSPARVAPPLSFAGSVEEQDLAALPMLDLPAAAAQPHELTTLTAGPDLVVPAPARIEGRWIPGGYPVTPEGALGQLRSIDETGLQDGDPATYARAYRDSAQPGAPAVSATGLYTLLTHFRTAAALPATGPVTDLTTSYTVTEGQIKGTADGGRFVVVCVLGHLQVGSAGRTVSAGIGDCQAMRWSGTEWQIAAGALAAPAPSAWPGTLDAVKAGYRPLGST